MLDLLSLHHSKCLVLLQFHVQLLFVIHGNPEISQKATPPFQACIYLPGAHAIDYSCLTNSPTIPEVSFSFFLVSSRPFLQFIKTILTPNPGL